MNDFLCGKDLPNSVEKILTLERLRQKVDTVEKDATMRYLISGMAGDIEYMDGAHCRSLKGQISTIHLWH